LQKEFIELIDIDLVLRVCQNIDGVGNINDLRPSGDSLEISLMVAISMMLIGRLCARVTEAPL
tara:strand:+ start:402 stop:590 length:189 start_codon:yes stop_codon:yes gene_type:complete